MWWSVVASLLISADYFALFCTPLPRKATGFHFLAWKKPAWVQRCRSRINPRRWPSEPEFRPMALAFEAEAVGPLPISAEQPLQWPKFREPSRRLRGSRRQTRNPLGARFMICTQMARWIPTRDDRCLGLSMVTPPKNKGANSKSGQTYPNLWFVDLKYIPILPYIAYPNTVTSKFCDPAVLEGLQLWLEGHETDDNLPSKNLPTYRKIAILSLNLCVFMCIKIYQNDQNLKLNFPQRGLHTKDQAQQVLNEDDARALRRQRYRLAAQTLVPARRRCPRSPHGVEQESTAVDGGVNA